MRASRRQFIQTSALGIAGLTAGVSLYGEEKTDTSADKASARVPVIDITDLYHPHQDPGDNLDLIAAYALPEIDLRAVILDVTQEYREPTTEHQNPIYNDPTGPRDPGIIPVTQLNYIFDRNVPYGIGSFRRLKSPKDKAVDAPKFQQTGIELILRTLRESKEKVEIASFGSARTLAAAYNREPELLRAKVRRIHLSAGASELGFLEWNVMLDPQAIVCLLRSDLQIAVYPCGTKDGAFAYGSHNSFWLLENLEFIRRMDPLLQRYAAYAFERSAKSDFLRVLDDPVPDDVMARICARQHNVWETAIWVNASRRNLVKRADGHYRIVPEAEVKPTDTVLPNELRPCRINVGDDGTFTWEYTDKRTNFRMYDRGDPKLNEQALREALPALYESFAPQQGSR
ncbi:MAG: hypothetical protein NTU88_14665 [Armatimonadetes bacterium]|nr:hypothetical protein [Armatimonadota bacterium]